MKKRIIFVITSILVVLAISIGVFASAAVASVDVQGPSYDGSHAQDGCCVETEDGEPHYDIGYNDGYTDGSSAGASSAVESFKNSEEYSSLIAEAESNAVQQYIGSQAFQDFVQEAESKAVEEYQNSEEFSSMKEDLLSAGEKSGYENGYHAGAEAMYNKGVIDGYANYRGTDEYEKTVNKAHQDGYDDGYIEGHHDGQAYAQDNSYNPNTIIGLLISVFGLFGLYIVVSVILHQKKKGKK